MTPDRPTTYQGPWEFTIRLERIISLNDRDHYHISAPIKKTIKRLAYEKTRRLNIPQQPFIIVGTTFHPPTKRNRDEDNAMGTVKPIIDGIRDAGLVVDDNSRHVSFLAPRYGKPTGWPWWTVDVIICTPHTIDWSRHFEPYDEDDEPPRARKPRGALQPCGTAAAASRHRRHGEPPCAPCRQAETIRKAAQRATRKAKP